NGSLIAFIEASIGNYVIAPEKDGSSNLALIPETKIFSQTGLPFFNCTNNDIIAAPKSSYKTSASSGQLLKVDIAVEADSSFYARAGGTAAKSISYIISLFSMVSMYYENEIGTTFHLTWIKVWD